MKTAQEKLQIRQQLNLLKRDNVDSNLTKAVGKEGKGTIGKGIASNATTVDFDVEVRANNDFNVVTTPALIDILNLVQRDNDDSMEG